MRASNQSNRYSLLSSYTADLGSLISRKRTEIGLRAANIESSLAGRAKTEFLANMSHELRTPLNAIIGFAEVIQARSKDCSANDKTQEYAGYITQAGRSLLKILNDILDMSNIEAGSIALNLEAYLLHEIVENSVALMQTRAASKKQTLRVCLPDDLPSVVVDEMRIKQALTNIISNAILFTPECGDIVIAAAQKPIGIEIEISDTGIGMTCEQIDYALRPFGQIKAAYSRDHAGTGLGLPIARALILLHDGKFDISSEPGVGTTVRLKLPFIATKIK